MRYKKCFCCGTPYEPPYSDLVKCPQCKHFFCDICIMEVKNHRCLEKSDLPTSDLKRGTLEEIKATYNHSTPTEECGLLETK